MDLPRCSDERAEHIVKHDVTVTEVEEVFTERPSYHVAGRDGSTVVYGRTSAGRHLLVVTATDDEGPFLVTAREMNNAERRTYQRKVLP